MVKMCQLSLNVPQSICSEVMHHLMLLPEVISGCTAVQSLGFGPRQHYKNIEEQIRGATERQLILMILLEQHIDAVIAHLNTAFQGTELFYWTVPIVTAGYSAERATTV